jgi:biopolymer transport protein ExbD
MKLSKRRDSEEVGVDLTPMIDVIFQLVLFFVFSMKFIAFEGQIQAYLPKDRGPQAGQVIMDPLSATLFLEWDPAEGGKVFCRTDKFQHPNGQVEENYLFPMEAGTRVEMGPDGAPRAETEAHMQGPTRQHRVVYEYAVPQWQLVEDYIRDRKAIYDQREGLGTGLPVTVNFENRVPWQAVANVLDICARVKITNFALNMQEIEP